MGVSGAFSGFLKSSSKSTCHLQHLTRPPTSACHRLVTGPVVASAAQGHWPAPSCGTGSPTFAAASTEWNRPRRPSQKRVVGAAEGRFLW